MDTNEESEMERINSLQAQVAEIRNCISHTPKYEIIVDGPGYAVFEVRYGPSGEKIKTLKTRGKRTKKSSSKTDMGQAVLSEERYNVLLRIIKGMDEEDDEEENEIEDNETSSSNDSKDEDREFEKYGSEMYKEFQEMLGSTKAFTDMMQVWHKYKKANVPKTKSVTEEKDDQ